MTIEIDGLNLDGLANFATFLEASPDCVQILDREGRLTSINRAGIRLLGIEDLSAWIGTRWADVLPEEALSEALKALDAARGGQTVRFSTNCYLPRCRKYCDITVAPLRDLNRQMVAMLAIFRDVTELVRERDATHAKTEFLAHMSHDIETLHDSDFLGEHGQRQDAGSALRSAQGDLEHAARLATMGALTASIAHELGQPLTSIVGNANACLRWLSRAEPNLERALQSAQALVRDSKRASDVVRSVRGLSKNGASQKIEMDLNAALQGVLDLLAGECARQSIALEVSLAPRLPPVVADRVQVQQAFLNLMLNAVQAMSQHAGRGVLKITSRIDGEEARVEIEDNGPGVLTDRRARIFDAFYTTKAEGLGLGLSLCRSIIEGHGGRLSLRDARPSGAVFEAALPLA